MNKIVLQGQLIIPAEELDAVLAALSEHKVLTQKEPGCLVFNVEQNADNPLVLDVYEEYESQEAFAHHQERTRASAWWQVTQHCERQYTITE